MKTGDKVIQTIADFRPIKPIEVIILNTYTNKKGNTWITTSYDKNESFPLSNNWIKPINV